MRNIIRDTQTFFLRGGSIFHIYKNIEYSLVAEKLEVEQTSSRSVRGKIYAAPYIEEIKHYLWNNIINYRIFIVPINTFDRKRSNIFFSLYADSYEKNIRFESISRKNSVLFHDSIPPFSSPPMGFRRDTRNKPLRQSISK